jgi:hypothetical protein
LGMGLASWTVAPPVLRPAKGAPEHVAWTYS